MPIASVHPMVVGRSDGLALAHACAPLEIKWRKKWSTGWTDGVKRGIGAFNVLCSRDVVKRTAAKPSAPVMRQSKASVQWRQQGQWLSADQVSPEEPTPKHRFNRWSLKVLRPCQRSQRLVQSAEWPEEPMHYAPDVPMPTQKAANGYKRLVRLGGLYIWAPQAIWSLLELLDIPLTPKNTSKPSKSIKIKSLVFSTSFVSVSAKLALEWVIKQGLDPLDPWVTLYGLALYHLYGSVWTWFVWTCMDSTSTCMDETRLYLYLCIKCLWYLFRYMK